MKNNILKLKDCYGCGVCVKGCPTQIISLDLSTDGFYVPMIKNENKCIECGICLEICAFNHNNPARASVNDPKAYGCWSNDEKIREKCTTGGISYEIAKSIFKDGYKICAVKYNVEEIRAEHYIVDLLDDLKSAIGSKYMQSFSLPGFKNINLKEKNLIIGLPCQIDSFRRLIRKYKIEENFILIDLLCYGTPSLLLWRRYLESIIPVSGNVEGVKFRSKKFGWHRSSCMEIKGSKQTLIQPTSECVFYKLFFSNSCLNKCCHSKCKYKLTSSAADIRIGDFWGKKYKSNEKGVNVLFSFTSKGDTLVKSLKQNCTIEPSDLKDALEGQKTENVPKNPFRKFVIWGLKNHMSLGTMAKILRLLSICTYPRIFYNKLISKIINK